MKCPLPVRNKRRVLCVFPIYTPAFGTFQHAYKLMYRVKAFMPPQGLLLIAAYMPESWPVRFIDENIAPATEADFAWADVVMVTGMHIQAEQIRDIQRRAKAAGKVDSAGRAFGVGIARDVPGLRLPPCRRNGRRDGPDRARDRRERRASAATGRRPDQGAAATHRLSAPGLRQGAVRQLSARHGAILVRLPVPLRVLRHPGPLRPPAAHEDAAADRGRARLHFLAAEPAGDALFRR